MSDEIKRAPGTLAGPSVIRRRSERPDIRSSILVNYCRHRMWNAFWASAYVYISCQPINKIIYKNP